MSTIAIFSDPHLGFSKDSPKQLEETDKIIDFIIEKSVAAKVKRVFLLGDLFHNRIMINVLVLNHAIKIIQRLIEHFELYIILGNHDSYYRHTTNVHSLKFLDLLKNNKKIHLITETTEVDLDTKKILLVPWLAKLDQTKVGIYDVLFGHLNITSESLTRYFAKAKINFEDTTIGLNEYLSEQEMSRMRTTGKDFINDDHFDIKNIFELLKETGVIFSGHFHLNDEFMRHGRKFIYVGAPLQQTWIDSGTHKGFYLYNLADNKIDFIENTFSPKHIQVLYSTFKNKLEEFNSFLMANRSNYLKIIFDIEVSYAERSSIFSSIQEYGNSENIETDSIFSAEFNILPSAVSGEELIPTSKFEYLLKFLNTLQDTEFTRRKIDKEKIINLLTMYFNNATKS
jgi:DNA repair exonuclease SbcCD nuclease subunit